MKALRRSCLWITVYLAAAASSGMSAWAGTPATGAKAPEAGKPAALEPGASNDATRDARALVVRLEDTMLDVMKRANELGFEGRLGELTPVVKDTFDLAFMAQTSIGTTWGKLTPELRARWVESFTRYTTTKFADQFDHFSGQAFVRQGERPASHETVIVMTSVQRPEKEPVRLDFRLHRKGGAWRIIDVYGHGRVSELALRRAEYDAILEQNGIEGLIASVDELSDRTARSSVARQSP
jgi:phospholipid transport system substrate-binding protein